MTTGREAPDVKAFQLQENCAEIRESQSLKGYARPVKRDRAVRFASKTRRWRRRHECNSPFQVRHC